ncbi:MAG: rhomboid family intramembrane serine protease [Pirellulales bacterium]|nr:rhomboid family intramembrane serine protease [Pirellulales bacterium]
MGIYDRSYYQDDQPRGIFLGGGGDGPMTVTTKIVIVTSLIFLVDIFANGKLSNFMACEVGSLTRPWEWWKFLTSGFAHSNKDMGHVFFNMLTLWIFGRSLENKYGRAEFLRFYLTAIVLASVTWAVIEKLDGAPDIADMYGASGAVFAVVITFAMNFPKERLFLFAAFPIPAWALGVGYIVFDVFKMLQPHTPGTPQIAHYAHFAGAVFGFLYVKFNWNLAWMNPAWLTKVKPRRGPKLRVHDPDAKSRELDDDVDQILRKIKREGEDSLTRRERNIMQKASREYKDRHRG